MSGLKRERFYLDVWLFSLLPKNVQYVLRQVSKWIEYLFGIIFAALVLFFFWDYVIVVVPCLLAVWGFFKGHSAWEKHTKLMREIANKK